MELEKDLRGIFSSHPTWLNRAREAKLSLQRKICISHMRNLLENPKIRDDPLHSAEARLWVLKKHDSEYEMWRHAWMTDSPNRIKQMPLLDDYEEDFP